ncbi:MAG: GNAT family N-acetyltransferase [Ruminococcus sp.]|uniref:GNAT family N-acetyltransferase n=1 Tax=Ruminococcus sp. TaxID=41978 RepID=UPI0025EEC75A|nr:GNAT family N-acetyltransferase [Ruminococcus sp.]MBR5681898.1 GNAT family N-acetyltransferase [Ruminococcus sp.]
MILREFKASDAEKIVKWTRSEREFRLWCADRYENYPIKPGNMTAMYSGCGKSGTFFPLTAVEEDVVGHLILRYTDEKRETVRFGFVIVDNAVRGRGLGRKMLELAKEYAVNVLNAKKLTLGVFDVNTAALRCYRAAGFTEADSSGEVFEILGESWKCTELEYYPGL